MADGMALKLTGWPPVPLLALLEVCVVGVLAVYRVGLLYLCGLRHDSDIQEGVRGRVGGIRSVVFDSEAAVSFFVPDVMPYGYASMLSPKP